MMNRSLIVALALQACAAPALGFDAKTCEDAGVGLASIATPVAKNHFVLYEGQVTVYNIDQIEPACCSKGVAVVLPDREDPLGGSTCTAIVGIGSVDATRSKRSYDAARGVLLEMATQAFDADSRLRPGPAVKLRIDLGRSKVSIEP
jgi:hypothetical protein